jgi:hypothetical protein
MALFPRSKRMTSEHGRDNLPPRWTLLAAALLIAGLFGFLTGAVKDAQFTRGVQAAAKGPETPHLAKRDPFRAVATAERKDSTGNHSPEPGGALVPRLDGIAFFADMRLASLPAASIFADRPYWPGPLPRAPPHSA